MRRPARLLTAAAAAAAFMLSGCGQSTVDPVAPLVGDDVGALGYVSYEPADLQKAFGNIQAAVATVAPDATRWSDVDFLSVQEDPALLSTALVAADRSPNEIGGGTAAASGLIRPKSAVFTLAGQNGACWAMRLSGPVADPVVEYTSVFSPMCTVREVLSKKRTWAASWPKEKTPTPEEAAQAAVPRQQSGPGGLEPTAVPQPSSSGFVGPGEPAPNGFPGPQTTPAPAGSASSSVDAGQ